MAQKNENEKDPASASPADVGYTAGMIAYELDECEWEPQSEEAGYYGRLMRRRVPRRLAEAEYAERLSDEYAGLGILPTMEYNWFMLECNHKEEDLQRGVGPGYPGFIEFEDWIEELESEAV